MPWKAAVLIGLCALGVVPEESVCRHAGAGRTSAVSLDRVRQAQEAVARRFAAATDAAARPQAEAGFESGLPACAMRRTRRVTRDVPAALVGRTIAFAPEGRFPPADVRVATSSRSLWSLDADALADAALAARLEVRCHPTLVRLRSEVELELVEIP
jgi:hypothetical protein